MEKGHKIPVLDHGSVELIDWMGDDDRVVFSARRSVQDGKKKNRPDDHLLDYLIRMNHHSPLEHSQITFLVEMPLFVFAHIVRHRTSKFSVNSLRYSSPDDLKFYVPSEERVKNAGGFSNLFDEVNYSLQQDMEESNNDALNSYKTLQADFNWPSELARINLPQSMYTNALITMDLRNCLHFLKERMSEATQWETRQFALAMFEIVKALFPRVVKAWENHTLHALSFSREEMGIIMKLIDNNITSINFPEDRTQRIFFDKVKAYKKLIG